MLLVEIDDDMTALDLHYRIEGIFTGLVNDSMLA